MPKSYSLTKSTLTTTFAPPSTTAALPTGEEVNYATLTLTIVRHLFNGKGYSHQEDWENYVNFSAIRDRCFFASPTSADGGEPQDRVECTVIQADICLERFLSDQNAHYFYIYIACSLFLVMLAILFNVIAIVAVTRCREKYPRHHVLISLSVSDLILALSLPLKRCGDEEGILDNSARFFLKNYVAVFFHIGYLMSAIGLLCLSLDNVLAIVAPYFYESLSRPRSTRILICCLWAAAVTFSIVIRLFHLHESVIVQIIVNSGMLILLVGVLSSYIFVCAQSHLHRRRLAVMLDDRRVVDVRTQLRGFLTTGLLVFWCLLCWSPLVGYWLTDVETMSSAHPFFTRYLVAALLVLHLNAVVDPVIYCLRLRDIRKSLFQLLGINRRGARQQSTLRSVQYSNSGQSSYAGRNGSARKSSPAYALPSDSSRRSYCVPTGKNSNSSSHQNERLLLTEQDAIPTVLITGSDDDKKQGTPLFANGGNASPRLHFQKGINKQMRALSAPASSADNFSSNNNKDDHFSSSPANTTDQVIKILCDDIEIFDDEDDDLFKNKNNKDGGGGADCRNQSGTFDNNNNSGRNSSPSKLVTDL